MKMIARTLGVTLLALFLTAPVALAGALSEGQAAERAGKLRQALTLYVEALKFVSEGSAKDRELREKIIGLSQKLQPPPAVPEKAHRYLARGEAFAEAASDKNGFLRAAKEFQAAAGVAPWLPHAYYNLGIVQDKAGQYKKAMQSLEFYLLAAPNAPDTREVRNLIYKIEARSEASHTMARKAEEEKKKEKGIESLVGIWRQYLGNDGYNQRVHYRTEVVGNDLLWIVVFDDPFPGTGKYRGEEKPKYSIRRQGNGFAGSTAVYDSTLATQEIRVGVSKDYKEVTVTEWCKDISPPKLTFTYHKCQNKNLSSCGW